jgi:threonine aldolase
MIEDGAWLRNATHENACARCFAEQIASVPSARISSCVQANAVFVTSSSEVLDALRERSWKFHTFIGGAARFMFSRDSNLERIDELCRDLRQCAEQCAMQTT